MADVTIGNLPPGIALGQCFVPLSDTLATVKVRVSALQVDYSNITSKPALATVATTGSYTDLSNKPTIPTSAGFSAMVSLATVGAGTWAKPVGITCIKVTVVGGGGGGAAQSNNAGAGGASVFDTAGINVTGGGGGRGALGGSPGAGGVATNGDANITGATGLTQGYANAPGFGAYGVGGAGARVSAEYYASGGAGGMAIKYMTVASAATSYAYTVGAGGGGSGGQGVNVPARAGTQGIILIEY